MTEIIVTGYPKSGTTWLTRLVAELVGCPVVGFYDSNHNEIAKEGIHRDSEYRCFKSHHQFTELEELNAAGNRIIYLIRDPRDICVSGAAFFSVGLEEMIHAVLHGSRQVHRWVRVPWKSHIAPFLASELLCVRYEDLLQQPTVECNGILRYLNLERSELQIESSIANQAFIAKKAALSNAGESEKARFLRVGRSQQWREVLSDDQKQHFVDELSQEIANNGYSVR